MSILWKKLTLLMTICLALSVASPSRATEIALDPICNSSTQTYLSLRNDYLASPKQSGQAFRELVLAMKMAERDRKMCIKSINAQFKDQLVSNKSRFDSMKSDRTIKREVREMQRRDEVSKISAARDAAIKSVLVIPELPARPSKRN